MRYRFDPEDPCHWPTAKELGVYRSRKDGKPCWRVRGTKIMRRSEEGAIAARGFGLVERAAVKAARRAKHYAFYGWPKWNHMNPPGNYDAFAAERREACREAACRAAWAVFAEAGRRIEATTVAEVA